MPVLWKRTLQASKDTPTTFSPTTVWSSNSCSEVSAIIKIRLNWYLHTSILHCDFDLIHAMCIPPYLNVTMSLGSGAKFRRLRILTDPFIKKHRRILFNPLWLLLKIGSNKQNRIRPPWKTRNPALPLPRISIVQSVLSTTWKGCHPNHGDEQPFMDDYSPVDLSKHHQSCKPPRRPPCAWRSHGSDYGFIWDSFI